MPMAAPSLIGNCMATTAGSHPPQHQPDGRIAEFLADIDLGAFTTVDDDEPKAVTRAPQHYRQVRRKLLGRLSVFIDHDDEAALIEAVSLGAGLGLRLDAAMADKMKDVPILFQQLLHQILSGSAGNPLENHPSFALKLV